MRIVLLFLLLFNNTVFAQSRAKDTLAKVFNEDLIAADPEQSIFIGYAVRSGDRWLAEIFSAESALVARGSYSSRACKEKEGWFTFYFPNGSRAASGQFHRDRKHGLWRIWYPSGRLKDSIQYYKDKPQGPYYTFFENGTLSGKGVFTNGVEDSTWTWYYPNGIVSSVEEYRLGQLKGQRCMDSLGKRQLENCKLYAEPMTAQMKTIWQLVKDNPIPVDSSGNKIEGFVIVDVHITSSGKLKEFNIVEADHPLLDSLARNLIATHQQWSPAYNHNRRIDYSRTLRLDFTRNRGGRINGLDPFNEPLEIPRTKNSYDYLPRSFLGSDWVNPGPGTPFY